MNFIIKKNMLFSYKNSTCFEPISNHQAYKNTSEEASYIIMLICIMNWDAHPYIHNYVTQSLDWIL
jgi:hypothetical protein